MSEHWWYVSRASGIVAWLALTATTMWGVALASGVPWIRGRARPTGDLHRWLAAVAMATTAVHLAALVADSYVTFDLVDLSVPMASEWQPGAVAFGVVAWWLLVAVQLTSWLRRRISRRLWHTVHLASYAACWLVTVHGAQAGSDASSPLYRATLILLTLMTIATVAYRVFTRRATRRMAAA